MSCKKLLILLLVGLLAVKTTNTQDLSELNAKISAALEYIAEHNPDSLSLVTEQVSACVQEIINAQGNPTLVADLNAQITSILANASNPSCGMLKNARQYYLKSADGKFAVVNPDLQVAFINLASTSPSKFTAVQKDCNLYAFYVNGYSMSRCEGCSTPLKDYQSVKFHLSDSNNPWSQWTLSNVSGRVGLYNLKVDSGFLTYKSMIDRTELLALDTQLSAEFEFIEVVENCGIILENGKQYYIRQIDYRYAILDSAKQLAFMRNVQTSHDATKFTAVQKSCNVYGFCAGNACMSRCENCPSDTGDYQTVRFHLSNSDLSWSQWTLTSPPGQYGGPYSLTAEPQYGKVVLKFTGHEDQLTLGVPNNDTIWESRFEFDKVN